MSLQPCDLFDDKNSTDTNACKVKFDESPQSEMTVYNNDTTLSYIHLIIICVNGNTCSAILRLITWNVSQHRTYLTWR